MLSNTKKHPISINVRRDLLVINMCIYLLSERNSEDTKINPNLKKFSDETLEINKKIDNISKDILQKLRTTIENIHNTASNKATVVRWCDSYWESETVANLFHSIIDTNLEVLANQILFINFCERKYPVHLEMAWLTNAELHYEFNDLVEQTNIYNMIELISSDAERCVKILKG